MDIKYPRRTDYTRYFRPRAAAPFGPTHTAVQPAKPETMTIAIRVKLPDYTNWKLVIFIKRYPYLSLAAAAGILLTVVITGDVISWLSHLIHNSSGKG